MWLSPMASVTTRTLSRRRSSSASANGGVKSAAPGHAGGQPRPCQRRASSGSSTRRRSAAATSAGWRPATTSAPSSIIGSAPTHSQLLPVSAESVSALCATSSPRAARVVAPINPVARDTSVASCARCVEFAETAMKCMLDPVAVVG